ncbi:TLR4 interactor with leucine rich repeats-like [Branchiostoma floridae]|uniref:TLR4 interactor with leucine rich repeats-like n=1 Tax=Branchiostoma floridae TaxID=7739 RepID=A0A9J7L5Q7_BRAFL|nr:TLR4 interactor with leucine rich repeats-like [Branchiostoma floridae]
MGRKLRHLLIFLLIILKEPNLLGADCPCQLPIYCKCASLGLTSIPELLPRSLTTLVLVSNPISGIPSGSFSKLSKIQNINLCCNQITNIQRGTFSDLPQLRSLILDRNKITSIQSGVFSDLPRLQFLNLDQNQIANIQPGALSRLPQLQTLKLGHNQITNIQDGIFSNFPQLQDLEIYQNKIATIEVGAFSNLPKLVHLCLHLNQIAAIQDNIFSDLPKLKDLNLSHNQITTIREKSFSDLPKLHNLYLASNQITKIEPHALSELPQLRSLKLGYNQIPNVPSGTVWDLTKLEILDLQSNKITTLPRVAIGLLASMSGVNIGNNPWKCDCNISQFRHEMARYFSASFAEQMICVEPDKFFGRQLKDINLEELDCRKKTITTLPVAIPPSPTPYVELGHSSVGKYEENNAKPTPPTIAPTFAQTPRPVAEQTSDLRSSFGNAGNNCHPTPPAPKSKTSGKIPVAIQASATSLTVLRSSFGDAGNNGHPTPPTPISKTSGKIPVNIQASLISSEELKYSSFRNAENDTLTITTPPAVSSAFDIMSDNTQRNVLATVTTTPLTTRGGSLKRERDRHYESETDISLPVYIVSLSGAVAVTALIVAVIVTIVYKRRAGKRSPDSDANNGFSNRNITSTIVVTGQGGQSETGPKPTTTQNSPSTNANIPCHNQPPPLPPRRKGASLARENAQAECHDTQPRPNNQHIPETNDGHDGANGTTHHYQPLAKSWNINGPTDCHDYLMLVANAQANTIKPYKDEPPPLPPSRKVAYAVDEKKHYQYLTKPDNQPADAAETPHHYQSLKQTMTVEGSTDENGYLVLEPKVNDKN